VITIGIRRGSLVLCLAFPNPSSAVPLLGFNAYHLWIFILRTAEEVSRVRQTNLRKRNKPQSTRVGFEQRPVPANSKPIPHIPLPFKEVISDVLTSMPNLRF
jgi:hypothetical protein